jgi:hypothetical protein
MLLYRPRNVGQLRFNKIFNALGFKRYTFYITSLILLLHSEIAPPFFPYTRYISQYIPL